MQYLPITNCPDDADKAIEDKEGYLDLFDEDKFLLSVALIKGAVILRGVVHLVQGGLEQ